MTHAVLLGLLAALLWCLAGWLLTDDDAPSPEEGEGTPGTAGALGRTLARWRRSG